MRRKTIKIKYFLISVLLLTLTGVAYSYLSTTLNISGEVTGFFNNGNYIIDSESNKNLSIDNLRINKWGEASNYKYQYTFNIKNNGDTDYDNFKITLTYNADITSTQIWNYEYEIKGKSLIVINKKYDLKAHNSLEVSYILGTSSSDLKLVKIKLETDTTTTEIDPDKFEIVFNKTNGWGNYVYQYNVTVTNKTGTLISYWQIDITLPEGTSYQSGWSALFQSSNNVLTIKNESYNGRIEHGGKVTFGLQLQTNQVDFIPQNYKVIIR